MSEWIQAEHVHRQYLQAFVCADQPWRRLRKAAHRRLPSGEFWSSRVQGFIRNLQPKVRHPQYILLRFNKNARRVESAAFYEISWSPKGNHRAWIYLMATHRENFRQGLGFQTLDQITSRLIEGAKLQPVSHSITISAKVHCRNEPCKNLIIARGWQFVETDDDGEHEWWTQRGIASIDGGDR